jgi:site-specific DNA recombinase
MFRMFIEGQGYGKIIDELNLRGFKTKTGRSFGKNSIHEILRNEKYIGNYIFNRLSAKDVDGKRNNHAYKEPEEVIRLENAVIPLVTREEFDQVQAKMARRKRARASNSAKEIYLLSGKIFCGECGYVMGGNRKLSGKNKTLHVSYRCSGRKNKHICSNKDIRREYIEAFVLDKLSQYVFDDSLIPKIAAAANNYLHETNAEVIGKKEAIGKRIIELTKEISNLVTLVAKYASEEIAARIPELEKERGHQEFEYKQICDSNDIPEITIDSIRTKFELARTYLKSGKLQTTQKLIEIFIKEVIVYEDHVEVFFNFHPDLNPPTNELSKIKQVGYSNPCHEYERGSQNPDIIGPENIEGGWGMTLPSSTIPN